MKGAKWSVNDGFGLLLPLCGASQEPVLEGRCSRRPAGSHSESEFKELRFLVRTRTLFFGKARLIAL